MMKISEVTVFFKPLNFTNETPTGRAPDAFETRTNPGKPERMTILTWWYGDHDQLTTRNIGSVVGALIALRERKEIKLKGSWGFDLSLAVRKARVHMAPTFYAGCVCVYMSMVQPFSSYHQLQDKRGPSANNNNV